jgi:dynein light chain LC8-type
MAAKGEAVDAGAAAAAALEAARAALPKPVVLTVDMPAEVVARCTELAAEALTTYKVEKDQAMHIKRALELWNGALWHVVVGASFGASVCHEVHAFVLFKIGKANVLCFQSFDDGAPPLASERAKDGAAGRRETLRARRGALWTARRGGCPTPSERARLRQGRQRERAAAGACGALRAACLRARACTNARAAACLYACTCATTHAIWRAACDMQLSLACVDTADPSRPLARSPPLPPTASILGGEKKAVVAKKVEKKDDEAAAE